MPPHLETHLPQQLKYWPKKTQLTRFPAVQNPPEDKLFTALAVPSKQK